MSMTLTIDGADRRFRFDWEQAAGSWARRAEPVAMGLLRSHAPVGAGPGAGRLRQSISSREEPSPGRMWVVFYTTVPYARYVLEGTRPHPIMARNARALRWIPNRGHGAAMFARSVHHPGTRPNPFPERALLGRGPVFAALFAEAVREAIVDV